MSGSSSFTQLRALIQKEFRVELRAAEALWSVLGLSAIFCSLIALGTHVLVLADKQLLQLFPLLFWFIFLAVTSLAISKVCEPDLEFDGLAGLLLSGVQAPMLFLAKVLLVFCMNMLAAAAIALLFFVLLTMPAYPDWAQFAFVCFSVVTGYSLVATLLALATSTAQLKGLLLPLVLLPLLMPLFFGALELTFRTFPGGEPLTGTPWLALLWGVNLIYLAVGVAVADVVIRG